MRLHQLMDPVLLEEMLDGGVVTLREHPSNPLVDRQLGILNYTPAAQYSRTWNDVTKQCRGLIIGGPWHHSTTEVIARPFPKFFNVSEHEGEAMDALPDWPFKVYPKLDGSLGILYNHPDFGPAVATRGSFQSDQAIWATKRYRETFNSQAPPEGVTWLFEIIYPENRIVVDYGDREMLVLLAAIDIETGADLDLTGVLVSDETVIPFDGMNDLQAISDLAQAAPESYDGSEGFVIRFDPPEGGPSVRAKAKYSEYVRLHRIVTGVNSKTIWEYLSTGQSLDELLDRVPDEFYDWVTQTADGLRQGFGRMNAEVCKAFMARPRLPDRKSHAQFWEGQPRRAMLFRLLDDRPIDDLIWKELKPTASKPFKTDDEA